MSLRDWYKKRTLAKTQPKVKLPNVLTEKEHEVPTKTVSTPTEQKTIERKRSYPVDLETDTGHKIKARVKPSWPKSGFGPASGFADSGTAYVRGGIDPKRVDAITAHEQMHVLFSTIGEKYGEDARKLAVQKLLSSAEPLARQYIERAITGQMKYDRKSANFPEEVLNYLHTYLTDPLNRQRIKNESLTPWLHDAVDRSIKRSWRNVLAAGQKLSERDLEKAIDDNAFNHRIVSNHSNMGPKYVNGEYHAVNHPAPKIFNVAATHEKDTPDVDMGVSGISPKMVLDVSHLHDPVHPESQTPGGRIMIKPYHQAANSGWNLPIFGWSTMTTKNLFHAAGMGHIAEDVTVGHHKDTPVTVHVFAGQDYRPTNDANHKIKADPLDMHKVGIMDYLTDNKDRHGYNMFVGPPDERNGYNKLLAIDHERSFMYPAERRAHPADFLHAYGLRKLLEGHVAPINEEGDRSFESFGVRFNKDLQEWWKQHSPAIRSELEHNLLALKDDAVRGHIRDNFMRRYQVMDDWANGKGPATADIFSLGNRKAGLSTENIPLSSRYETPNAILRHFVDKPPKEAAEAVARAVNNHPNYAAPLRFAVEGLAKRMSVDELADFFITYGNHDKIDMSHVAIGQFPAEKQKAIIQNIQQKMAKMPQGTELQYPFLAHRLEQIERSLTNPEAPTLAAAKVG